MQACGVAGEYWTEGTKANSLNDGVVWLVFRMLALISSGASPVFVRVRGGDAGPRAARLQVVSKLHGQLSERQLTTWD